MTIQETINWFISQYNQAKGFLDTPSDYYCGITNDLERRRIEHNISSYIATVTCNSFKIACEIEEGLHNTGFDTGEQLGNGTEDSIYVYMYRKNNQTKQ